MQFNLFSVLSNLKYIKSKSFVLKSGYTLQHNIFKNRQKAIYLLDFTFIQLYKSLLNQDKAK